MKRLILVFMTVLTILTVSAQELRFGIKGGLNISTMTQADNMSGYLSENPDHRIGFHIGGVLNYSLSQKWGVEADLLYSMQGCKDDVQTTGEQIVKDNFTLTTHYIHLPVAIKYYPIGGLYVECGPQLGYLLSMKGKLDNWETEDLYPSDVRKKWDFGIFGGVGYVFKNDMFVEARYIHGFTETAKALDGGKNRNIQISLGYIF